MTTLLAELQERGIRLALDCDRLAVDAPTGVLTPEIRATLAENKTALLEQLRQTQTPKSWAEGTISSLLAKRSIVRVSSRVLGEEVLWAADHAQIPSDYDLVVYREAELRELVGKTPEQLRKIHEVKKKIDGDIRLPDASDFSNGTEE